MVTSFGEVDIGPRPFPDSVDLAASFRSLVELETLTLRAFAHTDRILATITCAARLRVVRVLLPWGSEEHEWPTPEALQGLASERRALGLLPIAVRIGFDVRNAAECPPLKERLQCLQQMRSDARPLIEEVPEVQQAWPSEWDKSKE